MIQLTPTAFFKCLSDETRLKILLLLEQNGKLCVCDVHERLNLPQPKVSRHLAELRKVGILVDERDGKWVNYCFNPELPECARSVLKTTFDMCHERFPELVAQKTLPPCC